MADVLHVGQAGAFTAGTLPTGNVDSIFPDQLRVNSDRVLALRDLAGHVKPVSVTKVLYSNLLYEFLDLRGNASGFSSLLAHDLA